MYCSISEAWGDPQLQWEDNEDTDDSSQQMTFQEMHNLPGYGNLMSGNCSFRNNKQKKQSTNITPVEEIHETPSTKEQIQYVVKDYQNESQAHILNALLYIISGIYLIYTMDMFMRMGMLLGQK